MEKQEVDLTKGERKIKPRKHYSSFRIGVEDIEQKEDNSPSDSVNSTPHLKEVVSIDIGFKDMMRLHRSDQQS